MTDAPTPEQQNDQAISQDFLFLMKYLDVSTRAPMHYKAAGEAEECIQRIHVALRGGRIQIIEGGKPVEPKPTEGK